MGQLVSLQGDVMRLPVCARALAVLCSQAPPMPAQQLHGVRGHEYDAGWQRLFARFDGEPIAAALIGHVHRVTAAAGRGRALNVQKPGPSRLIRSDVDNVAVLRRLLNVLPVVHGTAARALSCAAAASRTPGASAATTAS